MASRAGHLFDCTAYCCLPNDIITRECVNRTERHQACPVRVLAISKEKQIVAVSSIYSSLRLNAQLNREQRACGPSFQPSRLSKPTFQTEFPTKKTYRLHANLPSRTSNQKPTNQPKVNQTPTNHATRGWGMERWSWDGVGGDRVGLASLDACYIFKFS